MPDEQPDSIDAIKKIPKLMQAVMEHMKKGDSIENLQFYFDGGNMEGVFEKWIKRKSGDEVVNVPGEVLSELRELADAEKWDKMKAPMQKGKEACRKLIERDVLPRFYQSPEYLNYVKKEKMGDPAKAAKLLGVRNLKLLTKLMQAQATGETADAKKLCAQLIKEEELQDTYEQIMKALAKLG